MTAARTSERRPREVPFGGRNPPPQAEPSAQLYADRDDRGPVSHEQRLRDDEERELWRSAVLIGLGSLELENLTGSEVAGVVLRSRNARPLDMREVANNAARFADLIVERYRERVRRLSPSPQGPPTTEPAP